MKKTLSLLLAILILIISVQGASFTALAGEKATEAEVLTLETTKECSFTYGEYEASPHCWVAFTPEETGTYQFNFTNNYTDSVFTFNTKLYKSLMDAESSSNYIVEEGSCYFGSGMGKEYREINPHFVTYALKKGVNYYLDVYLLVSEEKNAETFTVPVKVIKHIHNLKDFYRAPVADEPGDVPEGEYGKVCKSCGYETGVHIFKSPKAPSLTVKAGKRCFTATRKKNKSVKGFQLQYSTSRSFKNKKTKTYKDASRLTVKIKKLKKGKKYYVRIRTYKIVKNHRAYSEWSKVKRVKIK